MANHLLINWQGALGGAKGHRFRSFLDEITGTGAIANFVDFIKARTDVRARTATFCYVVNFEVARNIIPGTNCDRIGRVFFRDPDTLATRSFSYPDPQASDSELVDEGERLTDACVTDVVGAINAATLKSYTPLYGVVIQKR